MFKRFKKKKKETIPLEVIPFGHGEMLFEEVSPDDYTEPEESAEEINRRIARENPWGIIKVILETGGIYRFEPMEGSSREPFEGFPLGVTSVDLLLKITKGNNEFQRGWTVGVDTDELSYELKARKI